MLWRGFRAERIILCLLLKYVALEAQIMIRVIKPGAAACELVLEAWERSLAALGQRDGDFWGSPPFEEAGAAHQRGQGSIPHLLRCHDSFLLRKNKT